MTGDLAVLHRMEGQLDIIQTALLGSLETGNPGLVAEVRELKRRMADVEAPKLALRDKAMGVAASVVAAVLTGWAMTGMHK